VVVEDGEKGVSGRTGRVECDQIVSTFNVRGLGGRSKSKRIKELVRSQNMDFLAIQETKFEVISDRLCYSLWGSKDCNWAFLLLEENSGRILSICDKENF